MTAAVYPGSFDPLTIAHLAVAEAAIEHLQVTRIDLAISRRTLGKDHLDEHSVAARVSTLRATLRDRPRLDVVVVDAELIVDIASGYDAVVMGADKWAQVVDPAWYAGDTAARDAALARLPAVAVAPRDGIVVPAELVLPVPAHIAAVSATAVRAGRTDWAAHPD
ncbi:MAG: hypothetical protein ACK4V6_15525 [Microthrixaceae bacterium]